MTDAPVHFPSQGAGPTPSPSAPARPSGSTPLPEAPTKPLSQQASDLAEDVKQQVTEKAQTLTSEIKDKATELTEAATEAAKGAGDQLRGVAEEKKNAGADFGIGVAEAIRRAAGELDGHIPQAGDYIRMAADQIEEASDALRRRDFNQLIASGQDFARRQPTAFLGATVLAGFIAVRFFKSATAPREGGTAHAQPQQSLNQPYQT